MLKTKRIYQGAAEEDGCRILVDRLWPRGVSKEKAKLDYWEKEVAPSNDLRKDFHKERIDFEAFRERYVEELRKNKAVEPFVELLKEELAKRDVTLLFGAKNERENQVTVLQEWLEDKF
ncbi:hypothetical protein MFLO_14137 [Listeria floridensis FSL S10-1187]|uniref:Uroporphyrin-III C-methyltransferase n=1 Tax=Listeria floridensis FSL S10-1187 TaxID=1265817 RepID=A0ABN0RCB1_9LIST|nr:DUF488 family protein [Listeria floridensis]EUJ26362.1 hypothetical protein MFLO_14137 [Listeria floridensis FSL S10-1187]